MVEALKSDASLTVFRVRLARPDPHSIIGTSDLSTTLAPDQLVICEIEVTGDPTQRGVMPLDELAPPTRRGNGTAGLEPGSRTIPKAPSRTVAQWVLSPGDLQLPITYSDALEFSDRAGRTYDAISSRAKSVASKLLAEYNADALFRLIRLQSWIPRATLSLPQDMARELKRCAATLLRPEGDVLWIELVEPVGYLPLLPWEELLQTLIDVPVIRASAHPIQALSPTREMTVVLGCSLTSSKWLPDVKEIKTLITAIASNLPDDSTIHVFADDLSRPTFEAALMLPPERSVVLLHPLPDKPPDARGLNGSDYPEGAIRWDQPWMEWMTRSLGNCAVDILHWIAPGGLVADGGRLLVSRFPVPPMELDQTEMQARWHRNQKTRTLRYVAPHTIRELATELGAWGLIFGAPGHGATYMKSLVGLRLLVDQLSRLRPGVVALHQVADDPNGKGASDLYRFLSGAGLPLAPCLEAVSIYCHPGRASAAPAEPRSVDQSVLSAYTANKEAARATVDQPGPTPVWAASVQRAIEQAASRVISQFADQSAKSPLDEAAERGAADAFRLIDRIMYDKAKE